MIALDKILSNTEIFYLNIWDLFTSRCCWFHHVTFLFYFILFYFFFFGGGGDLHGTFKMGNVMYVSHA